MENSLTPPLLHAKQVARLLGVTSGTLKKWRQRRQGPPFIIVGTRTIRYREADVDSWVSEQRIETDH